MLGTKDPDAHGVAQELRHAPKTLAHVLHLVSQLGDILFESLVSVRIVGGRRRRSGRRDGEGVGDGVGVGVPAKRFLRA